jgi:hypothetical protein
MKINQIVSEIKKGSKDSNGFTKCWPGKHAEGTKKGKNGGQVRNCVPNEGVTEAGMPSSVVKNKQRYASMSDSDFAKAHKEKSDDELKAMAWRHGYGKGSSHYVNKRNNGQQGVAEGGRKMTGSARDKFISTMAPRMDNDALMQKVGKVVNSPEFNEDTILKIVDAGDTITHPVGRYIQKEFDELQYDLGRQYEDYPERVAEKLLSMLIARTKQGVAEAANAAQQAAIAIAKKKKKAMSETTVEIAPTQPTPGQDTVKINGQAVANTDAATATAIKTAAEKGQFTPVTDQPTTEGLFGTSEEELAKDPSPAGEYYRKLAALKTDPRWAAKQDIVQKRIQDLINRLNLDKGIPQPDQGQPAGPETDPAKFQQKNPNFKEGHKDTIAQGGGKIGGDPTDRYIAQIRDKKFTNAQRNTTGQRSPLGENDELYKWLTIAGIK